jgi:hypothetical protein
MKKLITAFLLTALTVSSLFSCASESKTDTSQTTAASQTSAVSDTEPVLETSDLDGFELRILNYDTTWFSWANTQMNADSLNGEILNDALYNRTLETEQNFNAKVTFNNVNMTDDIISQTVLAGDDSYDMSMLFDANIASVLTKGYLGYWDELVNINLSDPQWDADAASLYKFNGRQVAVSGDFSLYNYSTRHCYAFNKDMLATLNTGYDLYKLVNDGEWTLAKLYEIAGLAVSDINGDGSFTSDDRYGISGSVTRHYSALLAGANVRYVEKNGDGELYFAIPGNDYDISVMQKIVELNVGNQIFYNGVNDIGNNDATLFRNGHTLFTAAYINEVAALRDMDSDIGILPAPKFSEEQDSYYSLVEGGALSVILKSLSPDRYENAGILLNALAFYSHKEVIPAYTEVILKSKVSRDEESAAMIELIFNTSVNDLGTGVWSSIMKNIYTAKIFLPRSTDIVSVTASIEPKAEKAISDFMTAVNKQIES